MAPKRSRGIAHAFRDGKEYLEVVPILGKRQCTQCSVTDTPQWREGPDGPKTLCNACGVKWQRSKKHKSQAIRAPRPAPLDRTGSAGSESCDDVHISWASDVELPLFLPASSSEEAHAPFASAHHASILMQQPSALRNRYSPVAGSAHGSECPEAACNNNNECDAGYDDEHAAALDLLSFASSGHSSRAGVGTATEAIVPVKDTELSVYAQSDLTPGGLPAYISPTDLQHLLQLHGMVQRACQELQAANAAKAAVAQCLAQKQTALAASQQEARRCAQQLQEELRSLRTAFGLGGMPAQPAPGAAMAHPGAVSYI